MSFSVDGSSREAIQAIQFELWPDCNTGCQYCYLNGTPRTTTLEEKRQNILNALNTLKDPDILKEYNAVGLIGGEFFQGQIDGLEAEWFSLISYLNYLLKTQQIKEVWLATSLLLDNDMHNLSLLHTLNCFELEAYNEDQRLILCTSYDTIGRFSEEDEPPVIFSCKIDKEKSYDSINAFVNSLENIDTEEEHDIALTEVIKQYYLPTETIDKQGLVLNDGTVIDLDKHNIEVSAKDYYAHLFSEIDLNRLLYCENAIKVTYEDKENKKIGKAYFIKTNSEFTSPQLVKLLTLFKSCSEMYMESSAPGEQYNNMFIPANDENWKTASLWLNTIKRLKEIYPEIVLHVQIILTQDVINKLLEDPNYFDFITDLGCIIDFRYPSITRADCPSATVIEDYRSLLLEKYKDFPEHFFIENRSSFLKFLKVFEEKYGLEKVRNLIHQPEMRSRRLKIYIDGVEIEDRWNDDRDRYLECGHLIDGLCYIDSDKCIYCDIERFIENQENI